MVDGSCFRVKALNNFVQKYWGQKYYPTQNVLVVYSFDLKFTYVLPSWKESIPKSRILDKVLTRELNILIVLQGDY